MRYFIGITLPKEIKEQIISFQESFASNQLPKILEPHVTVKTKNGLTEDLVWLNKVKLIIENYPRFEISFAGIDVFGDSVVLVRVNPTKALTTLHKALFFAVNPNEEDIAKKFFENDKYEAHITLGMNSHGMTKEELVIMKERGLKVLSNPPKFNVTFIRIFKQENLYKAYEKFIDIPLNGK